jgi:hypothetical protein
MEQESLLFSFFLIFTGAALVSTVALSLKPIVFRYLLRRFSERNRLAWDAGLRLGRLVNFLC